MTEEMEKYRAHLHDTYREVLGTNYKILVDDEIDVCGNVKYYRKEIRINFKKHYYEGTTDEEFVKNVENTIRHELVHAFMFESGIADERISEEGLCDWIAVMLPKFKKTMDDGWYKICTNY